MWRRMNEYTAESDTDYRVTRGGNSKTVYTAWAPGQWHAWKHKPICYTLSRDEAVQACENHLNQRGKK